MGNFNLRRTLLEPYFIIPESLVAFCSVVSAPKANKQTNELNYIYRLAEWPAFGELRRARRLSPDALSNHVTATAHMMIIDLIRTRDDNQSRLAKTRSQREQ